MCQNPPPSSRHRRPKTEVPKKKRTESVSSVADKLVAKASINKEESSVKAKENQRLREELGTAERAPELEREEAMRKGRERRGEGYRMAEGKEKGRNRRVFLPSLRMELLSSSVAPGTPGKRVGSSLLGRKWSNS